MADEVTKAFLAHYYETVMTNRQALAPLYQDHSLMTFEGVQVRGREAIMARLLSLTYKSVKYSITTFDCQPIVDIDEQKSVVVTVMGQLQTDEDPLQSFVQTFVLRSMQGNFYVANEVFRVVLHNVPS